MQRITITSTQDLEKLEQAAGIVADGGVISYPTDTIYGLGCDPMNADALERIYSMKNRPRNQPLIVLLESAAALSKWCSIIPGKALPLILAWPAPLTIILKARPGLPKFLTGADGSLAFRVPESNLCRKLVRSCGGALTSTSVNRSGEPFLNDADSIEKAFGSLIDLLVEGPSLPMKSSTVVRAIDKKVRVLRSGAFPLRRIQRLVESVEDISPGEDEEHTTAKES